MFSIVGAFPSWLWGWFWCWWLLEVMLFDGEVGLLGGADGEVGGTDGGVGGGVFGFEYYQIVARQKHYAFGQVLGAEVAHPLGLTVPKGIDAACGDHLRFVERQLPRQRQLQVGVGAATYIHVGNQ